MRFKLSTVLAIAAGVVFAQGAMAADMPIKAPAKIVAHTWTGCYIGPNVGWHKERNRFSDPLAAPPGVGSSSESGVTAGGQAGCNYQVSQWVLGAEGMFNWTDADGDTVHRITGVTLSTDNKWIASATGRLGFVVDKSLFYVKGGAAWKNQNLSVSALGVLVASTGSHTRSGWTIGGGWEYAFLPGWSAKIEYDYYDFGSSSPVFCNVGGGCGINVFGSDQKAHTVLVGLNYRFFAPWR